MSNSYLKDFTKYASLNVLGMLALSLYILADTFFVSNGLGERGLASLNLAIPVYSFIHGSGLMLGMGGAIKYAVYKSQKEEEKMNKVFTNTFFISIIFAAFFFLLGLLFSKSITSFLGADSSVFDMTNTYIKIILLFSPAFILNDILICFVRNDGNPKLSTLAMLSGSLSNILLDYIFIFPLKMGIFGAVLATGIAPVISIAVLSAHWLKRKNKFKIIKTKISLNSFKAIISLGVSSLITEISSGVVMIVFNILILKELGNTGVAAYGVIANISLVIIAIFTGVAQGMQPLLSKAQGSEDWINIKKTLKYALFTVTFISTAVYLLMFIFVNPLISIFNSEQNLVLEKIAENGMKLYFIGIFFAGINIIVSMYFSATKKAVPAQIISILRGLVLIVLFAFLFSLWFGVNGIWLSFPAAEAVVTVFSLCLYLKIRTSK